MDGLVEVVVAQKLNFQVQIKRFIATVLPLMVAVYLILLNLPSIFKILTFLACVGLAYLSYRMFINFYIDWEYTFVTNEVSFAKVMNKSNRKDLFTCQVKDTVVLCKVSDKEHLPSVPADVKKYYFLSNTTDDYYIWLTKNDKGKDVCIYFEPNERMLKSIQTLARSKVHL